MTSTTKHVLLKEGIVTYIGTKEEAENSESSLNWLEIPKEMEVDVGYRYDEQLKSFKRVRGTLEAERKRLIQTVNYIYDLTSKKILSTFPEEEVKTFPFQVSELATYTKYLDGDINAEPIMLKAIAYQKGMELDALVTRTRALSKQLLHILGTVVGRRQWLEEEILAAKDLHRLDILEIEVNKFGQGKYRE